MECGEGRDVPNATKRTAANSTKRKAASRRVSPKFDLLF